MTLLEAYFDESYSDSKPRLLVVAGYLFEKNRRLEFDIDLGALLAHHGLPYFHMVDCAHGNASFKYMDKQERIEVATGVIELIRKYASFGVAFGVDQDDFRSVFPDGFAVGGLRYDDPYSYCCHSCLTAIQGWLQRHRVVDHVGYFFESGHASAPKAHALMDQILTDGNLRHEFRYADHGFISKTHKPLQSADMLAWLHYIDLKNLFSKNPRPRRKDFLALIENWPVEGKLVEKAHLETMRRQIDDLLAGRPLITGSWGSFRPFVAT